MEVDTDDFRSSSGVNFNSNLLGLELRLRNLNLSISGVVSTSSMNCKRINISGRCHWFKQLLTCQGQMTQSRGEQQQRK